MISESFKLGFLQKFAEFSVDDGVPESIRKRIAEFYLSNTLPMKMKYSPAVVGSKPGSLDFTENFPESVRYVVDGSTRKNGYQSGGRYSAPVIHYNPNLHGNKPLQDVLVHEFEHALARRAPSKIYTQEERDKLWKAYGIDEDIVRALGTGASWYDESAATNAEYRYGIWSDLYYLLGRAPSLEEYSKYLEDLSLDDVRRIYMEGVKTKGYLSRAIDAAKKRFEEENGPAPTISSYPDAWQNPVRVVVDGRKLLPGELSVFDMKNTDWYKKNPELFDKALSEEDDPHVRYINPANVLFSKDLEDYRDRQNKYLYPDDKMEAARTTWGEVAKNEPASGSHSQVVA